MAPLNLPRPAGVPPKTLVSSGSLSQVAGFSLRAFANRKKTSVAMEHTGAPHLYPSESLKEHRRRSHLAGLVMQQKQKEEDERGVEAARAKAQQKAEEEAREARRQARLEVQEAKLLATNARLKREKEAYELKMWEEAEKKRREQEERERLQREWEAEEARRRAPWQCEDCRGSGKCPHCEGNGVNDASFLVPTHGGGSWGCIGTKRLEFGLKPSGCECCGGTSQGIAGKLQRGTGDCVRCVGKGKIWPDLTKAKRRYSKQQTFALDNPPMSRSASKAGALPGDEGSRPGSKEGSRPGSKEGSRAPSKAGD